MIRIRERAVKITLWPCMLGCLLLLPADSNFYSGHWNENVIHLSVGAKCISSYSHMCAGNICGIIKEEKSSPIPGSGPALIGRIKTKSRPLCNHFWTETKCAHFPRNTKYLPNLANASYCFFFTNYFFSLAIDKIWDTLLQNYPHYLIAFGAQAKSRFLTPSPKLPTRAQIH